MLDKGASRGREQLARGTRLLLVMGPLGGIFGAPASQSARPPTKPERNGSFGHSTSGTVVVTTTMRIAGETGMVGRHA